MKKLLIFGATGPMGRHVVARALEQGHDVTAFVRDPAKLAVSSDRLHVIVGSIPDDPQVVAEAIRGQDAVISALGVGLSFKSNRLIERSMRNIVPAMEASGVRRLIFTSAFGVGGTKGDVPLLPRLMAGLLLRDIYADKKAAEDYLRQHDLDWTLVCPTRLTNGKVTGKYRVGEHLELRGLPSISRADVAHFMLTQLDDRTYVKKEVLVSF
jgi:putative NADH-flavin reductase